MKLIGGNSGYIGYSMSKGAAEARANGSFPKTDFKKEYKIPNHLWELLREIHAIVYDGWHHTSKFGNATKFYAWTSSEVRDIWVERRRELMNIRTMAGKKPRMENYPNTREGMAEFQEAWDSWIKKYHESEKLIEEILLG